MNAFWTFVSRKPLESTNSTHLFFGVEMKTFLIHNVMAVGLKFPGLVEAASFGITFSGIVSLGLMLVCYTKMYGNINTVYRES